MSYLQVSMASDQFSCKMMLAGLRPPAILGRLFLRFGSTDDRNEEDSDEQPDHDVQVHNGGKIDCDAVDNSPNDGDRNQPSVANPRMILREEFAHATMEVWARDSGHTERLVVCYGRSGWRIVAGPAVLSWSDMGECVDLVAGLAASQNVPSSPRPSASRIDGMDTADRFGFMGSGDNWGECGKCGMPFYTEIHQSRHSCTMSPGSSPGSTLSHRHTSTLPAEIESALDESGRLLEFATRLPFPCGPFVAFGDADNPQGLAINALTILGVPFSSQLLSAIGDIDGAFFQPVYLFGPDEAMFHNAAQGYLVTNWLTWVKEVLHLDLQ